MDLDHDRVHHVRLRTARLDGARRRVEEGLASADLHPRSLDRAAILLVRRLSVGWTAGDPRNPQRVRDAVEDAALRAARPARGETGDVVWFASRAELLACLARDGIAGRTAWWWQLLGARFMPASFVDRWADEPEQVPAIVADLVERRVLADVLVQIHAREARQLVRRVIERFALSALVPVAEIVPLAVAGRPVAPPWEAIAPEVPTSWSPPVQLLAGIALTVVRAEWRVRRRDWAAAATRWAESTEVRQVPVVVEDPDTSSGVARMEQRARVVDEPLVGVAPEPQAATAPMTMEAATSRGFEDVAVVLPGIVGAPWDQPVPGAEISRPSVPPVDEPPVVAEASVATEDRPSEPVPVSWSAAGEQAADPWGPTVMPGSAVQTALGGSFYLVNLALALDLYGDFSRPLHRDPGLPLWDLLAEGTARLLGEPEADPLWALLAALAGRPRLDPFADPRAVTTPADHAPPGYAWTPDPEWIPPAGWPPWDGSREGWFSAMERLFRDRLDRALSLAPSVWLRQRATVEIRPLRIDVRFGLAEHPIEVRVAGLDRDPGWVPAAGRDLRFWYT